MLLIASALPALLPIVAVGAGLYALPSDLAAHLWETTLPRAIWHSTLLVVVVATASLLIGGTLAALLALTEFPGRRWLGLAAVLPLAIPGYVMAIALIGWLDYGGPLAVAARALGISAWPEVRSWWGASLALTLVLCPYVILLGQAALRTQGARAIEAARALGAGPTAALVTAALPLAQPFLAGACLLVAMEVLADYGTVAAFNVDTLSSAIVKAWLGLRSLDAALAIAGLLMVIVMLLVVGELFTRSHRRYTQSSLAQAAPRVRLHGAHAWAAVGALGLWVAIALLAPLAWLVALAAQRPAGAAGVGSLVWTSAVLAGLAALLVCLWALLIAIAERRRPTWVGFAAARVALTGYGMPGALLAVGLYVPLAHGQRWLLDSVGSTLLISGGLGLLLLAYAVRFAAVAHAPLAAALTRIPTSAGEAARSLGAGRVGVYTRVYLPWISVGLGSALLLVAIDVIKELPITLMTRPFGWDTLAVRIFERSSEALWAEAAWPALCLVAISCIPVWLLNSRELDAAP